jgi:hypothetical protein
LWNVACDWLSACGGCAELRNGGLLDIDEQREKLETKVSSRGHFIGQVVDDLDAIASKVEQRCALGYTDLNRVLEDFFKEVLNLTYGINLQNLNKDRLNAPGLDLGDAVGGMAFQITSQGGSKKINETLEKISAAQLASYPKVFVLIIGKRQKTYALDPAQAQRCKFDESRILGTTELCREIIDLPLGDLQAVHRKIADEQRRIRIELEPQLPDGSYSTSVMQFIEQKPSVTRSDASLLAAHPDVEGLFDDAEEARAALDAFIDALARLPRLTREFFGWMIDESDLRQGIGGQGLEMNADYLQAMCSSMPNFMAEVRLLEARKFIDFDEDGSGRSGMFRIWFPGAHSTGFPEAFGYFVRAEALSARTMFSTMNFGPFGPAPAPAPTESIKKPADVNNKSKLGRGSRR